MKSLRVNILTTLWLFRHCIGLLRKRIFLRQKKCERRFPTSTILNIATNGTFWHPTGNRCRHYIIIATRQNTDAKEIGRLVNGSPQIRRQHRTNNKTQQNFICRTSIIKTLLAWAKKHQIAAVGLFLGDGDSVKVTQLDEELGHVGLAQPGSPKLINTLLENGYLPVVSSIGVTDEGQLMNVNADQAATALAATLSADLILLSDVSGILDGKGQRIAEMTAEKAEQLIEQGIITDGMIVKVNAALDAARTLGRPVDIASWRHADQLPALFNGMPMGTRILA